MYTNSSIINNGVWNIPELDFVAKYSMGEVTYDVCS